MMISVLTAERLRELLRQLPGVEEVVVTEDGRRFVAAVVARRFEGVDEGVRQNEVWAHLFKELTPEQRRRIEFVFTDTPQERAAASGA